MPKVGQGRPKVGQGRRKVGKDSVHEVLLPGGARMLLGVSFHYVGSTLKEPPAGAPYVVGSGRTLATLPPWDPVAGCYTLNPPALVSAPPELPRVPELSPLGKVAAVAVGLCSGCALAAWLT